MIIGVPKFDGEGANHVTENELKFHVECSLSKNRLPVISFNYFCSSSFNVWVTCAILAPNSGTESEILSRRTYQFVGIHV
jgi:hypothetical protein